MIPSTIPGIKQPVESQYDEPHGQDESGKTDAPMSEIGKDILKREGMLENTQPLQKESR
jgi:hypothetical protein